MKRLQVLAAAGMLLMAGPAIVAAVDGAVIYKTNCAKCHGETGLADSAAAKAMKAPALAGDAAIAGMPEAELAAKIKDNAKHATLKSLSPEDLATVAGYVKGLAAGK
jgi:mono/diheme cytochrome c family protein